MALNTKDGIRLAAPKAVLNEESLTVVTGVKRFAAKLERWETKERLGRNH